MWKDVPVLVTGGTGFMGSAVIRRLSELGVKVCVIGQQERKEVGYIRVDLTSASEVMTVMSGIRPKIVFHCASYGVRVGQTDEKRMYEVNVRGTEHLLKACELVRPQSIVVAGSWTEYGVGKDSQPFRETDVARPCSPYSQSRLQVTSLATEWSRAHDTPLQVLRCSQVYGSGEPGYRLIPTLFQSITSGISAKLGSRDMVRDFLFLDDAVDAFLWAAHRYEQGQIMNIGSGRGVSIAQVVDIFRSLFPQMPEPTWQESALRAWDVPMACLDVSLARQLGWQAKTSLREGLFIMTKNCQSSQNLLKYPAISC